MTIDRSCEDTDPQILLAAVEQASAEACAAMTRAYRGADSWVESIRDALAALLALLERNPRLARLLIVDSLAGDAAVRARRDRLLAELARALEAERPAAAAGSLPPPSSAEAVVDAVASILHGCLQADPTPSLSDMHGPLMSLIALQCLDVSSARGELTRARPQG
jgi:AcrR family transcriptional regulator